MTGHASIATDVLARYAADAAGSVAGVDRLVARPLLRHKGVRVEDGEDCVSVELRLTVAWGASIPTRRRDWRAW